MFSRLKRPRPELRRSPIPPEPPPPSRELIPLNNCEVDVADNCEVDSADNCEVLLNNCELMILNNCYCGGGVAMLTVVIIVKITRIFTSME